MIEPLRIVHDRKKMLTPRDRDFWDMGVGFFMDIRHRNRHGQLLYEEIGSHNMIVNEGLEVIWDVFFRAATAPTTFYMELYSDNGAFDKDTEYGDITELSGNGYSAVEVTRNDTGWPTLTESSGQMRITSKECTFTASGGAWSTCYGACIWGDMASDTLICWDDFSSSRTLQDGDSLDVTLYIEREAPTAE